jgi:hypothetical protein
LPTLAGFGRLQPVMHGTEGLAIVDVEWCATITKLVDMVGIEDVLWLGLAASLSILLGLALATSTGHHLGTPCPELRRIVDRFFLLPW